MWVGGRMVGWVGQYDTLRHMRKPVTLGTPGPRPLGVSVEGQSRSIGSVGSLYTTRLGSMTARDAVDLYRLTKGSAPMLQAEPKKVFGRRTTPQRYLDALWDKVAEWTQFPSMEKWGPERNREREVASDASFLYDRRRTA